MVVRFIITKIVIDPVTRISGLLKIEVDVENNKVVDARSSGSQFRGFEKIFVGREPLDIIRLAPRICGICSTSHAVAAVLALEDALKIVPDQNGKVVRDIVHGFELLQNHLRTTYIFAIPDFVRVQNISPISKDGTDKELDYRLPPDLTKKINEDYDEAIKYSREAHKAIAILAGKAPHFHGIWIGGITTYVDVPQIEQVSYIVEKIDDFVQYKMMDDINIIASYYKDYFNLGRGYGNLMDYGIFADYDGTAKFADSGVIIDGSKEKLNIENITENSYNSYLNADNGNLTKPGVSKAPEPDPYKKNAYSWIDAARYRGYAMEVGPLARMIINGYYENKISMMDRTIARVEECIYVCRVLKELLKKVKVGQAIQRNYEMPVSAKGVGLTGASRGALGHWITIENQKVANYTLIPPSAWNLSPTDSNNVKGPVEMALIGTEINSIENPVEIGRIVRSFDPCSNCACHINSSSHRSIDINII